MIRSLYFAPNGKLTLDLNQEQWTAALAEPEGLLWVDFQNTPPISDEVLLRQVFNFHPLAIDDALEESHTPKVDDWGNYIYIVLQAIVFIPHESARLKTQELDVFLGENYLITHHDEEISALERVWNSVQRDERHLHSGADHLLYRLVDELVASYMPVVEEMDDAIDLIEDEVLNNATPNVLERIFALKRAVLTLRRIIGPEREVLNKLARDDYPVIDAQDRIYFRDVYDHLVRLLDIIESTRDLIGGVLDIYLSVINNRMNDIMKTLTVITTLFMPLTFIVGFFGMNFFIPRYPQEWWVESKVFMITLGLMFMIPVVMILYMKRKKWL